MIADLAIVYFFLLPLTLAIYTSIITDIIYQIHILRQADFRAPIDVPSILILLTISVFVLGYNFFEAFPKHFLEVEALDVFEQMFYIGIGLLVSHQLQISIRRMKRQIARTNILNLL